MIFGSIALALPFTLFAMSTDRYLNASIKQAAITITVIAAAIFGAIHRLYFTPTFLESFPQAIISVLTVSLPIVILSAIGWVFVLYRWSKNRLHTS